jgi:hypothetical protein
MADGCYKPVRANGLCTEHLIEAFRAWLAAPEGFDWAVRLLPHSVRR